MNRKFTVARGPLARRAVDRLPRDQALPAVFRILNGDPDRATRSDTLSRSEELASLEAALFAADEPLNLRKLALAAGLGDVVAARRLVRRLQNLYDEGQTAFQVEEIAGGYQLLTRPIYHRWLTTLRRQSHELRLTAAMRETLAIVAYRQPIMRADIEQIRGVQCAETLRLLMERGLIRIAGRHDSLGRPVLYGTTRKFLQLYGLKNLKDLPRAEELGLPAPPEEKAR
jgi:segregation and condensation protein B